MKRLLDQYGDTLKIFHGKPDGSFVIERRQDCTAIVESNKAMQTSGLKPDFQGKWGRKVAEIPLVWIHQWMKEDGVNYYRMPRPEAIRWLKRHLNNDEFRDFRTVTGKV